MANKLIKHSLGRVLLHAACAFRGNIRWHLAGIERELFPAKTLRVEARDHALLVRLILLALGAAQFA